MAEKLDKKLRSCIMAAVKSKNTKPEINIRKALFATGLRYRLHDKKLPGHPDLVFPKYKAVIFIHGCFWHHHDCIYGKLPKTNKEFWKKKLEANAKRDCQIVKELEDSGWRVKVIWLCELKNRVKINSNADLFEVVKWVKDC